MVQLKKSAGTLDELVEQEDVVKGEIKSLQRQQKQIRAARKVFERLTASMPLAPKKSRRRKSVAATA